jgi:hypothetical protein
MKILAKNWFKLKVSFKKNHQKHCNTEKNKNGEALLADKVQIGKVIKSVAITVKNRYSSIAELIFG